MNHDNVVLPDSPQMQPPPLTRRNSTISTRSTRPVVGVVVKETRFDVLARMYSSSKLLMVVQIALALSSLVVYVVSTYISDSEKLLFFILFDWITGIAFLIDYLISIYVAYDRIVYMMTFPAIADLLSTLPLVTLFNIGDSNLRALKFFRLFKCTRVFRLYRFLSLGGLDEVRKQGLLLGLTVFMVVFFCSAVVHFLVVAQKNGDIAFSNTVDSELQFHDAFYFVVVTFTTVGYGDISPQLASTRLLMIVFIAASFVLLPYQASKLASALSTTSTYASTALPVRRTSTASHVVIVGNLSTDHTHRLLGELYHEDRIANDRTLDKLRTVLLYPNDPDTALKFTLSSYAFKKRLVFCRGSPLVKRDLIRVQAQRAVAIIMIFAPWEQDHVITLQVMAVHMFCPFVRIVVQVGQDTAKQHLVTYLQNSEHPNNVEIISTESLTMAFLAQSLLCPGVLGLVNSLTHSISFTPPQRPVGTTATTTENAVAEQSDDWLEMYHLGWSLETYMVRVGSNFANKTLGDVIMFAFFKFNIILVGIETPEDRVMRIRGRIKSLQYTQKGLNYKLQPLDSGYVLATSQAAADQILRPFVEEEFAAFVEGTPLRPIGDGAKQQTSPLSDPVDSAPNATANSQLSSLDSDSASRLRMANMQLGLISEQAIRESAHGENYVSTMLQNVLDCLISVQQRLQGAGNLILFTPFSHGLPTSNHLLLCVVKMHLTWLVHLVKLLMRLCDSKLVILCEDASVLEELHAKLAPYVHTRVFMVHGSPLNQTHLMRCRVAFARAVAVLSSGVDSGKPVKDDSQAVLSAMHINSTCFQAPNLVVELGDLANSRFLSAVSDVGDAQQHQQHQNHVVSAEASYSTPMFAAGMLLSPHLFYSFPIHLLLNPDPLKFLLWAFSPTNEETGEPSAFIKLLAVADTFPEATAYDELVRDLVPLGLVPVGLLRPAGLFGSVMPFVCTNPPQNTRLHQKDKVFVFVMVNN